MVHHKTIFSHSIPPRFQFFPRQSLVCGLHPLLDSANARVPKAIRICDPSYQADIGNGHLLNNDILNGKEEGGTVFSKGWQGYPEGFPEGEARGKS